MLIDDISESVRFSQMRDDFVTNVSEMIIRPSEDLQRLADVLEHGGMSPEQVAQAARDVRRSSAYVDHMVKNLLLLIKAQGDAPNAQSAVLDVREQVEVAVNELLPQARQRGITVSITGKGEPKVRGNATAIRAAIGKLVDNAIEYSPDNANVSVLIETTRDTKDALVRVVTAERESRSRSSRASSNGSTAERTRTSARSRASASAWPSSSMWPSCTTAMCRCGADLGRAAHSVWCYRSCPSLQRRPAKSVGAEPTVIATVKMLPHKQCETNQHAIRADEHRLARHLRMCGGEDDNAHDQRDDPAADAYDERLA